LRGSPSTDGSGCTSPRRTVNPHRLKPILTERVLPARS
jgi:hypothetical protein